MKLMNGKIGVLGRYNVFVGAGIINNLPGLINLRKYSNIFVITNPLVGKNFFNSIKKSTNLKIEKIEIRAEEKDKNIETVQKIWQKLLLGRCDRKSLVINFGGGVICDMGGFAAATFMRGIDFVQIPTTLLAQVDASVGGKTAVNFLGLKNLIGTFQQPIAVIIDTDTLSTLPPKEFISGFAEIIKHGLIADKKYFQFVTSKKPLDFSQEELIKIIKKSCQIKAAIISADEKENGLRKLLNFGHTLGHAIESLSQNTTKPLLHGEAVAIGMMAEGQISRALGLLSEEDYKALEQSIIQAGLPTTLNLPVGQVLEKIKSDKKNEKGQINWTLLKSIGHAIYNQSVDQSIVKKVL